MKYRCLSIAGFDGSGGAGLQADIKTFSALGCYGMTVLTALPIQNTCGVRNCYPIPAQAVEEQLAAIFEDIVPDAIKIGMLFSRDIIDSVAHFLSSHAKSIPIVLDPVMMAKNGHLLLLPDAVESLKTQLIPVAALVTPNMPEAQILTNIPLNNASCDERETVGKNLLNLGPQAVLVKGGHSESIQSDDLLLTKDGLIQWLKAERIETKNTHGTGCTLSAAICALLARKQNLPEACRQAKSYLQGCILAAKENSVGKGHGPLHHFHEWHKIASQKLAFWS